MPLFRIEGRVDYLNGTPLELEDKTPVKFHAMSTNPRTRYKYQCIVIRENASDFIAWFDKDGVPSRSSLKRVRNVQQSGQPRYTIVETGLVFYHKSEALRYDANSEARDVPLQVREDVIGEFGKFLSSQIIA